MTDEEQTRAKTEAAAMVAEMISTALAQLRDRSGLPMNVILAGAHAAIVTEMAQTLGGNVAARECTRVAARIEGIPSLADVTLAAAPTTGRA